MKKLLFTLFVIQSLLIKAQLPTLIKDIVPGSNGAQLFGLRVVGDQVFFIADDEAGYNSELWRTDGTEAGTYQVKDINPLGSGVYYDYRIPSPGDDLFFIANDGEHGDELWKSDGTDAGTMMVKDINPGYASAFDPFAYVSFAFTALNDILYFTANNGINGYELWRSDGTDAGTYLLKDIIPGSDGSKPEYTTGAGDAIYFSCSNSDYLPSIWKSDGTEAGTYQIIENVWAKSNDNPNANFFIDYHGYVYFGGGTDVYDIEVWRTDGTEVGTGLFAELYPAGEEVDPYLFNVVNDKLIFSSEQLNNSFFISDGTMEGTMPLIDNSGHEVEVDDIGFFLIAENKIYFPSAIDDYSGCWVTDLTSGGTFPLAQQSFDYYYGAGHRSTTIGNNIIFNSNDQVNGCSAIFESNGTPDGTLQALSCDVIYNADDMVTFNGKVIIEAKDGNDEFGSELWLYDPEFEPLSIHSNETGNINIYPNPANDFLIIKTGITNFFNTELSISDLSGYILYTQNISSPEILLNVSNYAQGMYIISITENNVSYYSKFVISE